MEDPICIAAARLPEDAAHQQGFNAGYDRALKALRDLKANLPEGTEFTGEFCLQYLEKVADVIKGEFGVEQTGYFF